MDFWSPSIHVENLVISANFEATVSLTLLEAFQNCVNETMIHDRSLLIVRVFYETYLWYEVVTTIYVQVIIIQKRVLCLGKTYRQQPKIDDEIISTISNVTLGIVHTLMIQTGETLTPILEGILVLVCPQNPWDYQSQTYVECENFEIAERPYYQLKTGPFSGHFRGGSE
ncbi:hypothetical protein DUI87_10013 [Hirundo rustica rustica]|uniref:Uncharacterized protein n=1 Tax=Hirundo rustica rustica TaxID=333673 RepID=A0A3M0KHD9_HIRRU|nr:hypothetical protein DUI87_10013 [Hirundo rustica rustica]